MENLSLLTEEQKARIRMEEYYRREVNKTLGEQPADEASKSSVWKFINSSFGLWFLSTIVVGLITFLYSSHEKQLQTDAEKQRQEAKAKSDSVQNKIESARRNADLVTGLLPHLVSANKMEWNSAMAVMGYLNKNGELPNELQSALIDIVQKDSDTSRKNAALAVLDNRLAVLDNKADTLERDVIPASLPPRIYIQIADDGQRTAAKALQTKLRTEGFVVPGIENVGPAKSPGKAQVRYYFDDNQPEADDIISVMRDPEFHLTAINDKSVKVNGKGARPRHYEIWFPAGGSN